MNDMQNWNSLKMDCISIDFLIGYSKNEWKLKCNVISLINSKVPFSSLQEEREALIKTSLKSGVEINSAIAVDIRWQLFGKTIKMKETIFGETEAMSVFIVFAANHTTNLGKDF